MKTITTAAFLIAAVLGTSLAQAGSTDSDRKHPLTFVKDSVITTKVKALLADEKMSSLVHVKVDTDRHGVVVLSGFVRSQEQKDKAASIASATEGVTAVHNNLRIKQDD
ncbi:MAG: BON domain-containing protein [Pseudomonadota bacterium]